MAADQAALNMHTQVNIQKLLRFRSLPLLTNKDVSFDYERKVVQ